MNMKNLVFLLILAFTTGFSQEITLEKIGDRSTKLVSIVSDKPLEKFYFEVFNAFDHKSSVIYQLNAANDSLVNRFEFGDIVMHLYASSEGLLYVTLHETLRLVVVSYESGKTIVTLPKRYTVIHKTAKYLFVNITPAYSDPNYKDLTGTVVLDAITYGEVGNTFMKGVVAIVGAENKLVVNKIVNWFRYDEFSTLLIYDCKNLVLEPNIVGTIKGIATNNLVSISKLGEYVAYSSDEIDKIILFNVAKKKEHITIPSDKGVHALIFSFGNNDTLVLNYLLEGDGCYYGLLNIYTSNYTKVKSEIVLGYRQFFNSKSNTVMLYGGHPTNSLYRIKF